MFLAVGIGRLRGGDLPHDHPRLLQGAAVPRFRLGHPRHARRAGHAQDGRAAQAACRSPCGTFIVGWLAIAGVPPFAGFWSKDEILLFACAESPALYVVGLVTALLTALLHDPPGDHGLLRRGALDEAATDADEADGDGDATATLTARSRTSRRRSMLDPARRARPSSPIVGGLIAAAASRHHRRRLGASLEHWLEPVVEFGEADITDTCGRRPSRAAADRRHRRRRSSASSSPGSSTRSSRIKAVRAELFADGLVLRHGVTAFMGGPGRKALRGDRRGSTRTSSTAPSTASAARRARDGRRASARAQTGYVRNYAVGHRHRRRAAARLVRRRPGDRSDARRRDASLGFPILTAIDRSCRPSARCVVALLAAAPARAAPSCVALLSSRRHRAR